jgi:diacylglycerol O-acyltransferase / trehalose O-mycolyltransferase
VISRSHRFLSFVVLALFGLAAQLIATPSSAGASTGPWPTAAADDGAHVTAVSIVEPGMVDLTIASPALDGNAMVRLLLPDGWRARPHHKWPVLYLLHGCCDTYVSWTRSTDVADIPALSRVLVVMPEAGQAGWYSNWWNYGRDGSPAWETFHLTEVRQILERGWRAGTRRAIAGLSMGGLGAIDYAARNPHLFRAAAAYSGALDTRYDAETEQYWMGFVSRYGYDPLRLWGDPVAQADVWKAHNPYDLIAGLRGTRVFVSSGTGQPGPLDPPGTGVSVVEQHMYDETRAFVARAGQLHIDVEADLYGPGTHSWPYWQRELHRSLPMLLRAIGACPCSPASVRDHELVARTRRPTPAVGACATCR